MEAAAVSMHSAFHPLILVTYASSAIPLLLMFNIWFACRRLLIICAVALSPQQPMLAMVGPIVHSAVGNEPSVMAMVSAAMSKERVCVTPVTRYVDLHCSHKFGCFVHGSLHLSVWF